MCLLVKIFTQFTINFFIFLTAAHNQKDMLGEINHSRKEDLKTRLDWLLECLGCCILTCEVPGKGGKGGKGDMALGPKNH